MYLAALDRASLFLLLGRLDVDIAHEVRTAGCTYCGGPLHWARYPRKPRGGPPLPEELSVRHGLCCGHCRRRTLPPSVLFLGRKVYLGAVVTLVAVLRHRRPGSASGSTLRDRLGVSWQTVVRWMAWWAETFPRSRAWRAFRGLVSPSIRDDDLPAGLCDVLQGLARLRSLLPAWARIEHAARGPTPLTQKMGRFQLTP